MSFGGNGIEKRQFGRRQTHLYAWVTFPGRRRVQCIVKDISLGGALLSFEQMPSSIPFCFRLTIESTKFESACEIRNSRDNLVGVKFVPMELLLAAERHAIQSSDTVEDWVGLRPGHTGVAAGHTPPSSSRR